MPDSPLQEIVCCMGQPVAGNPTQFMMEHAFAAAGLDWRYLTLEVSPEQLGDAIRGLRAMGIRGANITAPHQAAVCAFLDELSDVARWTAAVNCVHREGQRLIGDNTAGQGFVEALRPVADPAGKNVVILGAGGAARAVAVALARSGAAEIIVVNRTAERGQALVTLLCDQVGVRARLVHLSGDYAVDESAHILVNATSIGQGDPDGRVPVDMATVRPEMTVADVIFDPPQTHFLRAAAARGCATADGLGMLVHQGAVAFRTWTGIEPDTAVMRESLEEYLEI